MTTGAVDTCHDLLADEPCTHDLAQTKNPTCVWQRRVHAVVRPDGDVSNQLIEILEEWNTFLERHHATSQQGAAPCRPPEP